MTYQEKISLALDALWAMAEAGFLRGKPLVIGADFWALYEGGAA